MRTSSVLLTVIGILASCLGGCAAPADSEDQETRSDEAEVVSAAATCSSAAYAKALSHYRAAVDHAKLRKRGDVCGDGTMLHEIAGDLHTAVTTCAQFTEVIATSQWAQPVRDVLAGNLALAAFDGRLTVRANADKPLLSGLAAALPGATVFGPAPGALGNVTKITFGKNGVATMSTRAWDAVAGEVKETTEPARYSVGTLSRGSVPITILVGGKKTVYSAAPADDGSYQIMLTPPGGGNPYTDGFVSMPSECEA